jgi:hypothetical protein
MLGLKLSPALQGLATKLDAGWAMDASRRIPGHVGIALLKLHCRSDPLGPILQDFVSVVIRHLAQVGISDYHHSCDQIDFDLEELLQKVDEPMNDGAWLAILHVCVAPRWSSSMPGFIEAVRAVEFGELTVALEDQRTGLRTGPMGLLTAIMEIRGALCVHGASLSKTEVDHARPLVLALARAIIDTLMPVWLLRHFSVIEWVMSGADESSRASFAPELVDPHKARRLLVRRTDIELGNVLDFAHRRLGIRLAELEGEGVFDPRRYVHREAIHQKLEDFVAQVDCRALFLAGISGAGKSTAVFEWARRRSLAGTPVLLLRGGELASDAVDPTRLREHFCAELGTVRTFREILNQAAEVCVPFVVVLDGINEFTAAGRDASLLFQAINQVIVECRAQVALRVVVTARSEGLGQFLPGGELPREGEGDFWMKESGKPYLEVGTLTVEEGVAFLVAHGADADHARRLVNVTSLRTPDVLRKVAFGRLDVSDLAGADSARITMRVVMARLGSDGQLRSLVHRLIRLMNRTRDLTLDERTLKKAEPQLHLQLRKNGDALLGRLRELRIVGVVQRTRDGCRERTWAITMQHHSLFEAWEVRSRKLRRPLSSFPQSIGSFRSSLWLARFS